MYWYIVIKHIRCLPCKRVIDVRKVRTTQGADTPEDKALQDRYIESHINSRQGFLICPKCKRKASITAPPIALYDSSGNALRDDTGKLITKYEDEIDMATVKWDRYGHAIIL